MRPARESLASAPDPERRELEQNVIALGEALHVPERVTPRVLAQLDDADLERLRKLLLHAFKDDL